MLGALLGRMAAGLARGASAAVRGAAGAAEKAAAGGEGAMMRYGKQLTTEQLSHLKQKGFEPAKQSLGSSFIRSGTGRYAKESDIDKELQDLEKEQAKPVDAVNVSQEGAGGGSVLAVLRSIDGHLASILENMKTGQQKEAVAAEESSGEAGKDARALTGEGEGGSGGGAGSTKRNPIMVILGLIGATLVPLIKLLKSLYDEYFKPVFDKIGELFSDYVKPFFLETLPKFFMKDIPEFFTKTLPDMFFDGVTLFKSQIEKLGSFFQGLVGKMKETLGEVLSSVGDSKAVRFFLGDDNFLSKKGKELQESGKKDQEAANAPKLSLRLGDKPGSISKKVSVGETVEYKGQKFIVPDTQAELENIQRRIDQGDTVDTMGNVVQAPKQGGESVGAPPAAAPGAGSVSSPGMSEDQSAAGGARIGAEESSAQSMQGAGQTPSMMTPGGGVMESAGGLSGAEVTSATMAVTEPEPVPGTPGYDKLRKKLSGKSQAPANTSDNTTIPEVFPFLGTLGVLLYFNSDANVNPMMPGGGIG